jgi:hypothetical protein
LGTPPHEQDSNTGQLNLIKKIIGFLFFSWFLTDQENSENKNKTNINTFKGFEFVMFDLIFSLDLE